MKLAKTFVAVAALMALSATAQAGLWSHLTGAGSKCCDCAPTFQPECCKPTIVRPCHVNVYSYQRACAKPLCCDSGVNGCCCPVDNCCTNSNCCDTNCCVSSGCHGCAPVCAAPCHGYGCCAPCDNGCCNNNCCDNGCCNNSCYASCAAPCDNGCCDNSCCDDCCDNVCCEDACLIAELIYQSQTACYARQRRAAIFRLARFDCVCNPEIMAAFVYALNDAVETVRAAAADAIGDQLRRNPCCCSQCVICALTNALADCDWRVRRQAEQGLRLCGYDVVDGCCVDECCDVVCDATCAPASCAPSCNTVPYDGGANMTPPAPIMEEAPAKPIDADHVPAPPTTSTPTPSTDAVAPAPPSEDRVYFPSRLENDVKSPTSSRRSLKNLFSFLK